MLFPEMVSRSLSLDAAAAFGVPPPPPRGITFGWCDEGGLAFPNEGKRGRWIRCSGDGSSSDELVAKSVPSDSSRVLVSLLVTMEEGPFEDWESIVLAEFVDGNWCCSSELVLYSSEA